MIAFNEALLHKIWHKRWEIKKSTIYLLIAFPTQTLLGSEVIPDRFPVRWVSALIKLLGW